MKVRTTGKNMKELKRLTGTKGNSLMNTVGRKIE